MPRTFLWHTLTDETVPVENSLLLEKSLRRAGVSHEMHLFPHGVHGLALADMETSDIEKGRLPDRHIDPVAGALRGMAEGIKKEKIYVIQHSKYGYFCPHGAAAARGSACT